MKKFLLAALLIFITAGSLVFATGYAISVSMADVLSFAALFSITIPLGVVSGIGTMYFNDRALGLISPGHRRDWMSPGIFVGLDMAVLGILLTSLLVGEHHVGYASMGWIFYGGAPAIAALLMPVMFGLMHAGFKLADNPRPSNRGRRIPCVVLA